jgi:hypothetical protein
MKNMQFTLADLEELWQAQALLALCRDWVGMSAASVEEAEAVRHIRERIDKHLNQRLDHAQKR